MSAAEGFWKDDCYTQSAALTFYTLQSIVPLLAAIFGIAKGFGFDKYLEEIITQTLPEQKEILTYAIQIAYSMLLYIQNGVVAGLGVLFLFWTNLNLLGYIEVAFNQIWKVRIPRTLLQRTQHYLAIIIICPVVFVISSSLTVYLKLQIQYLQEFFPSENFSVYLIWLFNFVPLILSCLLFFFLYILMPNKKIKVWPRVVGSIFAGSIFQLWQLIYINFQLKIFSYNVVYGTFSLLPLFLIWLQFSWLIALAGAEIAAHMENDIFFDPKRIGNDFKGPEKIQRKELGLLILYYCFNAFYTDSKPLSDLQIATIINAPLNIIQEVLELFVNSGILIPIKHDDVTIGYNPMRDPHLFTIKSVCDIIDDNYDINLLIDSSEHLNKISKILYYLDNAANHSEANITLDKLFASKHEKAIKPI